MPLKLSRFKCDEPDSEFICSASFKTKHEVNFPSQDSLNPGKNKLGLFVCYQQLKVLTICLRVTLA